MSWAESEDAEATVDELRRSFESSELWEVEKFLGNGSFGAVMLLRAEKPLFPSGPRRVVLKQPTTVNQGAEDLLKEIEATRRLRDRSHIAQLPASREDLAAANSSTWFRQVLAVVGISPSTVFEHLKETRFDGPEILLEYFENGALLTTQERLSRYRDVHPGIPHRVLWSFCFYHNKSFNSFWVIDKKLRGDGTPS
ncbi:hypothetical protein F4808DRAFT_464560 [Astrocystis sublimbata]|nr:hypothetical protein F4808DRAFT_464560 [Astrocystis sublimbata]